MLKFPIHLSSSRQGGGNYSRSGDTSCKCIQTGGGRPCSTVKPVVTGADVQYIKALRYISYLLHFIFLPQARISNISFEAFYLTLVEGMSFEFILIFPVDVVYVYIYLKQQEYFL